MRRKTKFDQAMGSEPYWDAEPNNSKLMTAYNWYNYHYGRDSGFKFLKEYLSSVQYPNLDHIKKIPSWKIPSTMFWISKLRTRGLPIPPEANDWFENQLKELETIKVDEKVEKEDAPKPSVQDHMREKCHELIGEIEEEIDRFTDNYKSDFDMYKWLILKEVGAPLVSRIIDFYEPLLQELETVKSRKDPELNEAYSHMSRDNVKAYNNFIQGIVDSGKKYRDNKKKVRKPRKPKVKKAEQLVSKVNYLKDFPELQLVSVPPEKIVGSEEIWVYNVKYRTLGVYVAETANSLSIKGTTVQNYNETKSTKKKVRKPEDLFPKMNGKRSCWKAFNDLTTKPSGLSGRIDGNTILLKAF